MNRQGLASLQWKTSYKTSGTLIEGRPLDTLHDFYIPALRLATYYDRVAGYFRSSSLAAASQGFSVMVNRGGKIRLIVGADLNPEDVRAILTGSDQLLAKRLDQELDNRDIWSTEVANGVDLLAWMIANGFLELRVALRVHAETGEPLPYNSIADGYVHEKWFILRDEKGNRMYGSGSLNESHNALVRNAENIDIACDWWGGRDQERVQEAVDQFERFWSGALSHLAVFPLPEAVERRLIRWAEKVKQPVEIDGTTAVEDKAMPQSPSALERLKLALIQDAPRLPGGRWVGMETAPVEPWPHQRVVARRLIETWPYSFLLCDEVGLGKTIEAGLAFRSLHLTGLAKRILVAAPASLTLQWQRQMASKMLMSFGRALGGSAIRHVYEYPEEKEISSTSLFAPDLNIISTGLLSRKERAERLLSSPSYDIALVDEAHAARRRNPTQGIGADPDYGRLYQSLQTIVRKQAKSLWLATATPMQLDPIEVWDLLALIGRVGAFQGDPALTLRYYDMLSMLVYGQEVAETDWHLLRGALSRLELEDHRLWQHIEQHVVDARNRRPILRLMDSGRVPAKRDRQHMHRVFFAAAPLSRVMFRHNRSLLEIYHKSGELSANLPQRSIEPLPKIAFTPEERAVYEQLEAYCSELTERLNTDRDARSRNMMAFFLSFLRLRFASSLYAIERTLERRLAKVEATLEWIQNGETAPNAADSILDDGLDDYSESDDEAVALILKDRSPKDLRWERSRLQEMLEKLTAIRSMPSKTKALLQVLEQRRDPKSRRIQQTVVFTRFYDTLQDIVGWLRRQDGEILIGTYSGKGGSYFDAAQQRVISVKRELVKERFLRGEIDILVCTDAAAEGLNLQTADYLINFDLGWNPMKIEQRIGRIDRIGNPHREVSILNLCYAGSAEEIVYGRLLHRLRNANLVVGPQQISLLPVYEDDFRRLTEGEITAEELAEEAEKRIQTQRRISETMGIPADDLYTIYQRMAQGQRTQASPITLDQIWDTLTASEYLQSIGCRLSKSGKVFCLSHVDGLYDDHRLTADRSLYEAGDGEGALQFSSYGDPIFDVLVEHISNLPLPPCIQRISVQVEELAIDLVGYVVSVIDKQGQVDQRLVTSYDDIKDLQLSEHPVDEQTLDVYRERLRRIAAEEFSLSLAVERIEKINQRHADIHMVLNYIIFLDLFDGVPFGVSEDKPFWPVFRSLSEHLGEKEAMLISSTSAEVLRPIADDLLINIEVPAVGSNVGLRVPAWLVETSLRAGERVVTRMKRKKSEVTISMARNRVKRELEQLQARIR